jgi:hypothetical protein
VRILRRRRGEERERERERALEKRRTFSPPPFIGREKEKKSVVSPKSIIIVIINASRIFIKISASTSNKKGEDEGRAPPLPLFWRERQGKKTLN